MTQTQRDVASNEVRIDKSERRVLEVKVSLEKAQAALDGTIKRVTFLESRAEDLENRGRRKNLRLLGS